VKDKSSREIQPGNIIVYGQALGRCASINYGKVISVKEKTLRFVGLGREGYAADSKYRYQKCATLQFESRILIVTRNQVNAKALMLLDGIDISKFK